MMCIVLRDVELGKASEIIKRNAGKMTLLMIGTCEIFYSGRASSKIGAGERIILIKEDGATLVHRPRGYKPINWQPPGCHMETSFKENKLHIKIVRREPKEVLKIIFSNINILLGLKLRDEASFILHASEEDMRRAVLLNPNLIEEGFQPIQFEKPVTPGFVDLYGQDKNGKLVVIEFKRRTAGVEAINQLVKYLDHLKKRRKNIRGIVAAPGISTKAKVLAYSLGIEFVKLTPKRCAEILVESSRLLQSSLGEFIHEEKNNEII